MRPSRGHLEALGCNWGLQGERVAWHGPATRPFAVAPTRASGVPGSLLSGARAEGAPSIASSSLTPRCAFVITKAQRAQRVAAISAGNRLQLFLSARILTAHGVAHLSSQMRSARVTCISCVGLCVAL